MSSDNQRLPIYGMKIIKFTLLLLALNIVFKSSTPSEMNSKVLDKVLKKNVGIENAVAIPLDKTHASVKEGTFYKIYTSDDSSNNVGYLYSGRVQCCRSGGCDDSNSTPLPAMENEYFEYCIYFDNDITIKTVKVTSYRATHGQEVTAKSWLKQFIGFSGSKELRPGKEIDAISGATISVYAITADIEHKTKILNTLVQ